MVRTPACPWVETRACVEGVLAHVVRQEFQGDPAVERTVVREKASALAAFALLLLRGFASTAMSAGQRYADNTCRGDRISRPSIRSK